MLSVILLVLAQGVPVCTDALQEKCWFPTREQRGTHLLRSTGRSTVYTSVTEAAISYAFFEFAPTSGVGLDGGVCAGGAVSSATGQAVAVTRASSAYCTKEGFATTGLTNSSLVYVGANTPRIEYNDAGVLAIRTETARTNIVIQSQDFTDGTWATYNLGAGAATITANQGIAPDGTNTADRLQVGDCPSANWYSVIGQSLTATTAAKIASVYVKGYNGSDGGIQIQANDTEGGLGVSQICSYNPDTWTRCYTAPYTFLGTGNQIFIGCNNTAAVGGSNSGAADVLVWQADLTDGPRLTSPIYTTTAAVTRARDAVRATLSPAPFGATADGGGCVAATVHCMNNAAGRILTYTGSGGTFEWDVNYGASNASTQWYIGSSTQFNSTLPRNGYTLDRWVTRVAGAGNVFSICKNGTCQDGGTRGANSSGVTSAFIDIGNYSSSGFTCDGLISQIQIDPDYTRCQ